MLSPEGAQYLSHGRNPGEIRIWAISLAAISNFMYHRQQASMLKQQFWTSFGRYMAPVPSAEGSKINWVNYKTGVKDVHFKLQADHNAAMISIQLTHADRSRQSLLFNRFMQLKNILHDALQEEWQWSLQVPGENNKPVSSIHTVLHGVSVFKKEDWPLIISFLKPRIIALDIFWTGVKDAFGDGL